MRTFTLNHRRSRRSRRPCMPLVPALALLAPVMSTLPVDFIKINNKGCVLKVVSGTARALVVSSKGEVARTRTSCRWTSCSKACRDTRPRVVDAQPPTPLDSTTPLTLRRRPAWGLRSQDTCHWQIRTQKLDSTLQIITSNISAALLVECSPRAHHMAQL